LSSNDVDHLFNFFAVISGINFSQFRLGKLQFSALEKIKKGRASTLFYFCGSTSNQVPNLKDMIQLTMTKRDYFQGHPQHIRDQVEQLISSGNLKKHLLAKYPTGHEINTDKQLYEYANSLKQNFMKKSPQIDKVKYGKQKDLVIDALGTHTFVSRNHGGKLKNKHEIRIAASLKIAPKEMLEMLVVHELAHFKEKDHNKAFYNLCEYMQPNYCEVEVDMLLFLTLLDQDEELY
jgi:predicted metal-dependent hydrolase